MVLRYVLSLVFCSMLVACGSDAETTNQDLIGSWKVSGAKRNGKVTQTLNGAWFRFKESGSLVTNITGSIDSAAYELIDMQVHHHGTENAVYRIVSLDGQNMEVAVELRGMAFRLNLEKTDSLE